MSAKQAPPPIKAKPKVKPAVKPKPAKPSCNERTPTATSTPSPAATPSPTPPPARQLVAEPSSSSQPLHASLPEHELYGNLDSPAPDTHAGTALADTLPARMASLPTAIVTPAAHADQPDHELYGNLAPATLPDASDSHTDEPVAPVPPPLQPRGGAVLEHTYVNTQPTARPVVEEEEDDNDDNKNSAIPTSVGQAPVPEATAPINQHLTTLYQDLSLIVGGEQTRVRSKSVIMAEAGADVQV